MRREYAIYLDHCQRHGVTILRGDTSLDLTGRAFGMDFAAEAELRQIYLKARYNVPDFWDFTINSIPML